MPNPSRPEPVERNPAERLVELLLQPAQFMHMSGDHAGAERAYRTLLNLHPDHALLMHNLGVLLVQRGQVAEGLDWLRRAIARQPDQAAWHNDLGFVLAEHRAVLDAPVDEIAAAFKRALQLDERCLSAHGNLGLLYDAMGDVTRALHHYRRACALDPSNQQWIVATGRLLVLSGRAREAASAMSKWLYRQGSNSVVEHHLRAIVGKDVPERASDAYVADVFDGYADTFDQHLANLDYRAPQWVASALPPLLGEAHGDLELLDAGCGTGLCAPLLRPYARALVGVDLSQRMLDKSRERGGYDELVQAEIAAYAEGVPERFHAIVSADTLCYFGRLDEVIGAFCRALKPSGALVFTVERHDEGADYVLREHGRYQHSGQYVERAMAEGGFSSSEIACVHLRNESGKAVMGWLVSARKAF